MVYRNFLIKEITVGICIGLFLMSFSTIAVEINKVKNETDSFTSEGNTLYVGGSGPDNYSRIQYAIENATSFDTIFVYSGTYFENIVVDQKEILLIGEDRDTTIIDGSNLSDVVEIVESYVTINNFTIRNSGDGEFDAGVKVWTRYTKIINSYFTNNHRAIFLEVGSLATTIKDNEIVFNYHGVYSFTGSLGNTICDNIIRFNNRSAVYLYGSHFNEIFGNTLSYNSNGVVLDYGQDNLVSNNIVENNIYCGILLIEMSDRTSIYNNTISNTMNLEGVAIVESSFNKIKNNTIFDNHYNGIGLIDSSDNNIIYNSIYENKEVGLSLTETCEDNIIRCNDFDGNIKADFEVSSLCTDNLFYQNNFLTSTLDSFDNGVNRWDDSKYGNYWSDYEERYPDAKKEFLQPWMWDTPYEIPGGGNKDNCPLINLWSNSVIEEIKQDKTINRPILNWFQGNPYLFPLLQKLIQKLSFGL